MKKIIPLILILTTYGQIHAQDTTKFNRKISIVPHYLIFNGIRIDLEPLNTTKHTHIIFAPQLYYREKENRKKINNNNYFEKLQGAGIDIYKKFMFGKNFNLYFAAGGGYKYLRLQYPHYIWYNQTINQNEVLKRKLENITQQIHRIDAGIILGIENPINNRIFWELYGGIGIKYSISNTNHKINETKFDNFMTAYGYKGFSFFIGFKIGLSY